VFISSPMEEPKGTRWRIRRQLYECSDSPPYEPWIYEIEGVQLAPSSTKASRSA